MGVVRLVQHTGAETLAGLDALADVYDEIYAEPPYNSGPLFTRSAFLSRTRAQAPTPGFTLITAEDSDEALAGFSFGLPFGRRWWGGEATTPPEELKNATKFAVIELLVRQPFRGSGLGRDLMTALLAERPEDYAMLTSVPEAPAHTMYERWGWHKVGTVQPTATAPVMDAMAVALPWQRR